MGIGHINRLIGAVGDLNRLDTVIRDPIVNAGGELLDIIGAGSQAGNGNGTGSRSRKGRTGNGFCARRIRIYAKLPPRKIRTSVGGLLNGQAAGDLLIHGCNGDRMIRRVLIQGLGPGGRTIRAVTGGIGSFRDHIGAEGQLTGLGITTGIGRTNVEGITSFLIDRLELGTCQIIAVGVFLIDLNKTGLIDDIIDIQMEEGTGSGCLGAAALAHILDGADLRTAGVTNVDNEVILTTVGAAGIVEIISAGINGCVGEAAVRLGENDNVTGHHVCISSGCIGILGNAASCLGSQVIEARIPGPNRCSRIAAAIHGGCLDGLMDVGGVDAFDIGQVVAHVVGHKGRTN